MTVPYLLRFCPFRALMGILFVFIPRVSLRLPWAMRTLGFQPARFACPRLCAHWALLCIIGFTSAIQACLIAFGLNDHSARLKLNPKL